MWSIIDITKESYERPFNKKVRHSPVFRKRGWDYEDKSFSWTKEKNDAATQDPSGKLTPKKTGPVKVLQVRNHTATVNVKEIHNVISIDRITLEKISYKVVQATDFKRHNDVPRKSGDTEDEYVVGHICWYQDNYQETTYLVRKYCYSTADDTWKPSHQIPPRFICRYWESQRCVEQQNRQVSARDFEGRNRDKSRGRSSYKSFKTKGHAWHEGKPHGWETITEKRLQQQNLSQKD